MKTIEEFYKELAGSKELQDELKTLNEEAIGNFLRKHDCEGTAKEFTEFAKAHKEGEIEDGVVEAVAGGLPGGPIITPPRPIHKPQGVV